MSNKTTLLAWVNAQDEVACGATLELLGFPQQTDSGHDTPDEHGLVALTGLPADSWYASKRYAIKEVADALPEGPAKDCATRNVAVAHAYWIIEQFIPVCREIGTGQGSLNGQNIPNTFACAATDRNGAFLDTVAAATKYFAAQPNPVTGQPFAHP